MNSFYPLHDNDLLPDTTVFQANAKTVNELFVQNFMYYDVSLDSTERATLSAIANQCPLAGGEAVLIARAMLDAVVKTPVLYNDALLCEQPEVEERSRSMTTSGGCSVAPNPASTELTLRTNAPDATRFVLRNAMGQSVLSMSLTKGKNTYVIPVSNIPQGAYTWEVWAAEKRSDSGKVVIMN